MAKRNKNGLPVIIGHHTRTGLIACDHPSMGGKDIIVVGLKKEIRKGETFESSDIDWVKTVMHFEDPEAMQRTVDFLTSVLASWK